MSGITKLTSSQVTVVSGSVTVTSVYTYTNPLTSLLTQTNSDGVITGMPGNGPTAVDTSQPAKATIPAGLPNGETTIFINASSGLTSFGISVGPSTTKVENGGVASGSVIVASSSGAAGGGSGGSGGSGGGDSGSGSDSNSDNAAAPTQMKAAAGVLAFGALAAVLL